MPHKPDYLLITIIIGLLIFGLIILSSTSIAVSQKKFGENYYYLKHQIINGVIIGLISFIIAVNFKYFYLKKISVLLMGFFIILMFLVLVIGPSYQGAQRWLSIGGISFQPSEFFKIAVIIFIARWLESRRKNINDPIVIITIFVILAIISVFFILQPDIGTLGVILLTSLIMYFYSDVKLSRLFIVLGITFLILLATSLTSNYRLERIISFFDRDIEPQGISYQINQSLMAIGSGGIFGQGLGKSIQKFNFLPEPISDSIFSILAEELGFFGVLIILIAFIVIFKRGLEIARKLDNYFGELLAVGLSSLITIQAFINILSISGLIPLTGIPLPFFSYGGSHLISTLVASGILVNLSKFTK